MNGTGFQNTGAAALLTGALLACDANKNKGKNKINLGAYALSASDSKRTSLNSRVGLRGAPPAGTHRSGLTPPVGRRILPNRCVAGFVKVEKKI